MHFFLILAVLLIAVIFRLKATLYEENWTERWQKTLIFFLFPPLLLLITAIAIFWMGAGGEMVGFWDGWVSYCMAGSFLLTAILNALKLFQEAQVIIQQTRSYPLKKIAQKNIRIIKSPALISAIIGFWEPEFTLSTGLLKTLTPEQIEAVIAHEQAHYEYRDSFWFFWLGWVRNFSAWLPNTQTLWEELLTLRELRADAKAAEKIDKLILAEALLLTSHAMHRQPEITCIIGIRGTGKRLELRINALLAENGLVTEPAQSLWLFLLPALFPLLIVPFHK